MNDFGSWISGFLMVVLCFGIGLVAGRRNTVQEPRDVGGGQTLRVPLGSGVDREVADVYQRMAGASHADFFSELETLSGEGMVAQREKIMALLIR